jgi:thiol-disulfide isomerase/thioredoxin
MKALLLAVALGFTTLAAAGQDGSAPPPASSPAASAQWQKIEADGQAISAADKGQDVAAAKPEVTQIRADLADFLRQFGDDPHVPMAKFMAAKADQLAVMLALPGAPKMADVNQRFHALATDAAMPPEVREQAAGVEAQAMFHEVLGGAQGNPHNPAMWDELDRRIGVFEKNAGDGPGQEPWKAVVLMRQNQVMLLDRVKETARLQALLATLAKSPQPDLVALAQEAQAKVAQDADLLSKPLDLKFTALDGTAVDLAQMRGKVVLVDFWATWCPPCRGETPDVVAAYQKYHAQGFEIVGISLDQDKAALQQYITDNHMPWPQYFDGKGWGSDIGQRFGIDSIPAMWLIGKDGLIATQNGRDDLAGQVAKLLAAP